MRRSILLLSWVLLAQVTTHGQRLQTEVRRFPTQEACVQMERQLSQVAGRSTTVTTMYPQSGAPLTVTSTTTYTCMSAP